MVLQDYLEVRVSLALVVYETSTLKSVIPEVCAMHGIETEDGIAVARKLQTHRYIEIQVSGERIQNHGQKGNVTRLQSI
jgi:hypothetical protein